MQRPTLLEQESQPMSSSSTQDQQEQKSLEVFLVSASHSSSLRTPFSELKEDKSKTQRLKSPAVRFFGKRTPDQEKEKVRRWVIRNQNPLIKACEEGNLAAVKKALRNGASIFLPDVNDRLALPAAIWSMNKELVQYIDSRLGSRAPKWQECVEHNKKHYGGTFIVPEDEKECQQWLDKTEIKPETTALLQRQQIEFKIEFQEEKAMPTKYREEKQWQWIPGDQYYSCCGYSDEMSDQFFKEDCTWIPWIASIPGVGCGFGVSIFFISMIINTLCLPCHVAAACCGKNCEGVEDCSEFPWNLAGLSFACLSHALCFVLPCKGSFQSIPYEEVTGVRYQVANSQGASHTLFSEAQAIREVQQWRGVPTTLSADSTPPPSMQML